MNISQAIKDFPVIRSIFRLVSHNSTTGGLDLSGVPITGIASYTYAQFVALTAGEKTALAGLAVHISDVHTSSDGIGGSYVTRDSSPAGWAQISGPMYYATFDLVPAAGSYPGWRYRVGSGIGIGGADIYDTGTRLRYVHGSAYIKCIYADVLHTTDFSVEKILSSFTLPVNNLAVAGKCIMQDGDTLDIRAVVSRSAVVTNLNRTLRFGAAGTTSDTSIESLGLTTSKTLGDWTTIMRRSSTSLYQLGAASSVKWCGASSAASQADDPVSNMDNAVMTMSYGVLQSANTDEGVVLEAFMVQLNHTGA